MFKVEDEPEITVDMGCKLIDVACTATESFAKMMAEILSWFSDYLLAQNNFDAGGALWGTAIAQTEVWLGLAVLVTICTAVIGISLAAVRLRPDLIKRSLIGAAAAFPATLLSYVLVFEALKIIDDFTLGLIDGLVKDEDGYLGLFQTLFGKDGFSHLALFTSPGVPLLILLILVIGMLLMFMALAFRDFVLMLLVAFAPLAFILLPLENGTVWLKRWAAAVVAMLLAKPILMGTYSLIVSGFSRIDTVWGPETITLGIGLIITSFMPLMLFSFFNFMGGSDGGDQVGSAAAGAVKGVSSQVTSRMHGSGGTGRPGGGSSGADGATGADGSHGSHGTSGGGQEHLASGSSVSGSYSSGTDGTQAPANNNQTPDTERPNVSPQATTSKVPEVGPAPSVTTQGVINEPASNRESMPRSSGPLPRSPDPKQAQPEAPKADTEPTQSSERKDLND